METDQFEEHLAEQKVWPSYGSDKSEGQHSW